MKMCKKKYHSAYVLTAMAIVCTMMFGCSKENAPTQKKEIPSDNNKNSLIRESSLIRIPEFSPLRKSIVVAEVSEQSIERNIHVPGSIEADAARLIKITPPVSGRIIQMYKTLGDSVKIGDPLFSIDSADMALAYSDASKTQTALSLARRNLQRQKELADAEISARKDYEQAESDFLQANSDAERTRARLSQLGTSLSAGAGHHYQLRSPIAGKVIELTGSQGSFWNDANVPLMTIADLSTVWLVANVQEKDASLLFMGQTAKIILNAFDNDVVEGKVRYIGDILDPETRTIKVRVAIDNRSGRFKPGMFAKVILSGSAHRASAIPLTALVQNGFNTRVFVEKSPWNFEPRIIKTGAQIGDKIEVVSGLQSGERIVIKEGVLLND
ncbi:efflux RND transporter periplasmic adaptor subunit [Undibacterium sp. RuTC16W]|uniref:efflux RND transporter periplasmic adaptor subunit n=1 Tax=Undibacterium sp. RuTC16W TaxID=3413048 RepID=UPI003BF1F782